MCKPKKTPQAPSLKALLVEAPAKKPHRIILPKKFIRNFAFGGYGYESNCLNLTF